MPFRPYVIVGLLVLAVGAFAFSRSERDDRPRIELTPEAIEALQEQADDPTVQAWLGRAYELPDGVRSLKAVPPDRVAPHDLDVTVDPSGRPYDQYLGLGATVERRPLAVLHAPSRHVLFVGGEYASYVQAGEYEPVTLEQRPGRRYPVDAVWLRQSSQESIVGIVIVERPVEVVRWQEVDRTAYFTDAGLGAVTTTEWAAKDRPRDNEVRRLYWDQLVEKQRQFFVADVDGHDGDDTLVFANGYGDGGFPSVAGYDATGRRAQLVLWTMAAPWRLAFPEGRPPSEVSARERALAACVAGERKVDGMQCRIAPG